MIGKIKRGKSFAGVCDYVLRENKQAPGRIIGGNMCSQTPQELAREFEVFAALNTRVKVPVKHFSLSFAEEDGVVSDDTKHLLAMDYMEQMGYGNSQYVVVDHDRTDHDHAHDHIHIVANSVAMDGTWVNDRLDWKHSQTVLRALEPEHNLTPVVSSWDKVREKSVASKLGYQVERSLARGMELSQIEQTHTEIQSRIEQAATGATSITQFCSQLQVLKIKPIAKITRTGKVQGISYGSGDVVVRGSDLKGASFPALQQRGIKFDPARDLNSLRSAIRGIQIEIDRDWVEKLPVIEAENLEVATELVFAPPEILENPIVTADPVSTLPEIATIESPLSDYEQEWKDRDWIRVIADYPELKQEPGYQAAAARSIDLTDQEPVSRLIDQKHTIDQFERGLSNSITALLASLELQRQQQQAQEQERQCQLELERQRQLELEKLELQRKIEVENSLAVTFKFKDDDPEPDREHDHNWDR